VGFCDIVRQKFSRQGNFPLAAVPWSLYIRVTRWCGRSSGVEHNLAKVRVVSSNLIARSSLDKRYQAVKKRPPGRFLLPQHLVQDWGSRGEAVGGGSGLAAAQKKRPIPSVLRRNRPQLTEPVHENLSFCYHDLPPSGLATLQSWCMKAELPRNDPRHLSQHRRQQLRNFRVRRVHRCAAWAKPHGYFTNRSYFAPGIQWGDFAQTGACQSGNRLPGLDPAVGDSDWLPPSL
jgi:hypothetical protein